MALYFHYTDWQLATLNWVIMLVLEKLCWVFYHFTKLYVIPLIISRYLYRYIKIIHTKVFEETLFFVIPKGLI